MLPLAVILRGMGHRVSGSDRSYDQGRTPEKFAWIKTQGIGLFTQDGFGITKDIDSVLISKAVEDTVPDIVAAKKLGISIKLRVDMLVELFNAAKTRIAVAGTSGKTTTTGMSAFLLREAGLDPTVMNGGIFKNYMAQNPYSTAFVGRGDIFLTEMDESDGIDHVTRYTPDIAVLHNITLDHQPMEELQAMFGGFLSKTKTAILNADDDHVMMAAKGFAGKKITYSMTGQNADLAATQITPKQNGIDATITGFGEQIVLHLNLPGRHNISNALAALCVAKAAGMNLSDAAKILSRFIGIKRRMDVVGEKNGIVVMDDFAHNPDKIAATLTTLKEFPGRLHVFFQPHGYGFLKVVGKELAESFAGHLDKDDKLYLVEPFYAGGTVDRSIGSTDVAKDIVVMGKNAVVMDGRDSIRAAILKDVQKGDRIIIMGARDDTLSDFAKSFLN